MAKKGQLHENFSRAAPFFILLFYAYYLFFFGEYRRLQKSGGT